MVFAFSFIIGWKHYSARGHSGAASFRAMVNPMVNWIWAGGVVLILGAIVTMWPSAKEIREESAVRYSLGISA